MARPIDTEIVALRLEVIQNVEGALGTLSANLGTLTESELEDQIEMLNGLLDQLHQFVQMHDQAAFELSKRINDVALLMKAQLVRVRLSQPVSRTAYVYNYSTLQDIAKRELGDKGRWPEIAKLNNIRYSTDLLSMTQVLIP